jgi:hypothetical protein
MTRWINDAQKALAAALTEKMAWDAPQGHSSQLVLFALQLKLQASTRLLNEDYVGSMQGFGYPKDDQVSIRAPSLSNTSSEGSAKVVRHDQELTKAVVPCKTKKVRFQVENASVIPATNFTTSSSDQNSILRDHVEPDAEPGDVDSPIAKHMDLESMGIEASSAVNASIFRAERERLSRTGEIKESDPQGRQINYEASSALNAAIFRAQRDRVVRNKEGRETSCRNSNDMQIEASSAINASIFRKERKRIARDSEKKARERSDPTNTFTGCGDQRK